MGFFSRDDTAEQDAAAAVPPPHPALASLDAFAAASLEEAAAAVLLVAFADDDEPGSSLATSQVTLRAQELVGPATGLSGGRLLKHFQDKGLQLVINESVDVLRRSLLVYLLERATATPEMVLTRRGRRALDSGAPERWMDVPADPLG